MSQRISYIVVTENISCRGVILGQLIVIVCRIRGKPPVEILEFQDSGTEHKFHSIVHLLRSVVALCIESRTFRHPDTRHQILVVVAVVRHLAEDPVTEEAEIHSHIESLVLLPAKVRVRRITHHAHTVIFVSRISEIVQILHDKYRVHGLVHTSCITETGPETQCADDIRDAAFHPWFFIHIPGSTSGPVHIELLVASEIVRSVAPDGAAHDILVPERVGQRAVKRSECVLYDILSGTSVEIGAELYKILVVIVPVRIGRPQRRGMVSGDRVIAVSLGSDVLGIRTAYFRSAYRTQGMVSGERPGIVQLSAEHVRGIVGRRLRDGAVFSL